MLRAGVTVEAVVGAVVDVHGHIRVGVGDRPHLVERDAGIEFAEVQHRRRRRRAVLHSEHLAAVVPDGRGDRKIARSDPRDASAEAVADHGHGAGVADVLDRCGNVEHRGVECDRHHEFDTACLAGVVVAEFHAALTTVEQCRSDRPIAE